MSRPTSTGTGIKLNWTYLQADIENRMEIVRQDRLIEFVRRHPNTRASLNRWYGLMQERNFGSFTELRSVFPHVSRVGKLTIFNIAGNNVRLIVSMRYNEERVYIRHVLTHAEYDKGRWRE